MFEDILVKSESKEDVLKKWSIFFMSFITHFSLIVYVLFGHLFSTETELPNLRVIDVYLSHKIPTAPVSMRAAKKKTQKKTKLVEKDQNIKKVKQFPKSVLIVPIEVPGKIIDDEDDFLVSDVDFGAGGGVEGGIDGGSEGGIIGGSVLGEFVENEIKPVRISGKQPKLIKYVKPIYPVEALKFRITGFVMIEATVGQFGKVKKWRVLLVDGHQQFRKSAIDAIKQWQYEPYLIKGKPTPFIITATITFDKI